MGGYSAFLAGLQYRPRSAQSAILHARLPLLLTAVREPDNQHDMNAVALYIGDEHIGYLQAKSAAWVSERIDGNRFIEIYIVDVKKSGLFSVSIDDVELLIATSIFDAPDGTSSAMDADKQAEQQIRDAKMRAEERDVAPVIVEAVALLRWMGGVGKTDGDRQDAVIGDYILSEMSARGLTATRERAERLRSEGRKLKGSKARAMKALDVFCGDRQALARLLPVLMSMARSDGTIDEAEALALRDVLARARAAVHSERQD
jgi:tellurite resistance protein